MRSADPTAKQIIRNKVRLQTENVVQWADRLPIERPGGGEARADLPPPPVPPGTDLRGYHLPPLPLGVSDERPLEKRWQAEG